MRDSNSSGKKPIEEVQALRPRKPKLEPLRRETAERKRAEEKEKKHFEQIQFLSRTAMELVEFPFKKDIYQFIGEKLKELVGDCFVVINSYDKASDRLCTRAVSGLGKHTKRIIEILGREPVGKCYPINDEDGRRELLTGRLVKGPEGLHELTFGEIPKGVCRAIEELLGLRDIYAIGLTSKGELLGTVIVITRDAGCVRNQNIIETFMYQAAVALQRRLAGEALQRSKKEWETTFDAMSDWVALINLEGRILLSNCVGEEFTGVSSAQMVSQSICKLVHGTEKRIHACPLAKMLETGERAAMEFQVPDTSRWLMVTVDAVIDKQGNIVGAAHITRDITERKRAEEALRESEEKYREIVELAPDSIVTVDLKGMITSCNSALLQHTGYTKEDFVGKHISKVPTARLKDIRKYLKIFGSLLMGKVPKPFEFMWIHKNGSKRWGELRVSIMRRAGKITGFQAITREITKRKRAEEAYRSLVDHSLQGLAIFQEGRVVFANQAMADITGYTMEEMLAYPPAQVQAFVHPDDRELVWSRYRDRLNGEKLPERYDFRGIRKDGSTCWLEIHASRIEYNGKPAIQAAYVDITERKRAEEALRESQENYRTVSGLTSDYIVKTKVEPDGQMVLVSATDRLENMTGYAVDEFRNSSSWSKIVHPDDFDKFQDFWKRIVSSRKSCELEFRGINSKQEFEWLHAYGQPILNETDDRVISIVFAAKDITERKKAEVALRASEQRYRTLIESSHELIFCKDSDGHYHTLNLKAAIGLGGTCIEDIEGKTDCDLLPKKQADALRKIDKQVMESGKNIEAEEIVRNAQGENRIYLSHKWPIYDDKGRITGISCFAMDITERTKAEELLRNAEKEWRNSFDSLEDVMLIIDTDYNIENINEAGLKLLVKSKEEIIGKKCYQVVSDADGPPEECPCRRSLKTKKVESLDRYENKFGKYFSIKSSPIFDENGEIIKFVDLRRDITERKKAEEALRISEEEKKILLNTILEHVVYRDTEMRVLWANKAACESVSLPCEQLVGRYCYEIWHQRNKPCVVCPVKQVMKTGQRQEMEVTTPDGRIWFIRAYPILNPNGEITGIVNTTLEITERKRAGEKLLDYQAQLKSLASQLTLAEEYERRRIAAELHDKISQSLVISKLKLEALRKSVSSAELGNVLNEVCNSLGQTIAETRSLTSEVYPPLLALLGFEEAVAEWLTEQIEEKYGIATEFKDDGQPKPLDDDIRILLFRDVRELLTNIVRHANAHKVRVSIRKVGSRIWVKVKDDGIGFDLSEITWMPAKTGGFGLFSIRERLEEIGGRLKIESKPGHGTTVTITAPLKAEKNAKGR